MAIIEDMTVYFADFGVPVVFGSYSTLGIFNAPGSDVDVNGLKVCISEPSVLFATASLPTLANKSQITVNGVAYSVRDAKPQDDGAVTLALLRNA